MKILRKRVGVKNDKVGRKKTEQKEGGNDDKCRRKTRRGGERGKTNPTYHTDIPFPHYLNELLLPFALIVGISPPKPPKFTPNAISTSLGPPLSAPPTSEPAPCAAAFLILINTSLQYLILSIIRWCNFAIAGSVTGGKRDLAMISASVQRVMT